jgi:hypothetical protein
MDAEEIVRKVAAAGAPLDLSSERELARCAFCARWTTSGLIDDLTTHKPGCPWRLAREWVAAHPA